MKWYKDTVLKMDIPIISFLLFLSLGEAVSSSATRGYEARQHTGGTVENQATPDSTAKVFAI